MASRKASASSSSSSDESLPSLDVLKAWPPGRRHSPLKSKQRQQSWADPAEESILTSSRTAKQKSVISTTIASSSSSQKASIFASTKSERDESKQKSRDVSKGKSTSSKTPSTSSRFSAQHVAQPAKPQRLASVVPDSEDDDTSAGPTLSSVQTPKLVSKVFATQWTSPPAINTREEQDLAALLFPPDEHSVKTPAAVPSTSRKTANKSRRLTIINIPSDSEDEDSAPVPSTSSLPAPSTPAIGEDSSPEEVSFADYSDQEASPIVPEKAVAKRIIDLDSSDSEYDVAAGVVVWNPSPNKTRTLQSSPRKPFGTPRRPAAADSNSSMIPRLPSTSSLNSVSSEDDELPSLVTPKPKATTKSVGKTDKSIASTPAALPPKSAAKKLAEPKTARKTTSKNSFAKERDAFAQKLIQELDEAVFGGKLPQDISINWNGRLNTTAGRASWKKSKGPNGEKIFLSSIELATKVIDSEEKLRNTLSHEICHIAAWAIDKEMKPAHGPAFKFWGKKIMKVRKDISVTTRHSYEIAYKYSWQCTSKACAKIYGRHSKSIDPAKHACGVCAGVLVQLDKDGNPLPAVDTAKTPKKESEWQIYSKTAFKRIKAEQPKLTMTQINQLVAAEWQALKLAKTPAKAPPAPDLVDTLGALRL